MNVALQLAWDVVDLSAVHLHTVQLLNFVDHVVQPAKQFTQHLKLLSVLSGKLLAFNVDVLCVLIDAGQIGARIILLLVNDV